MFGFLAPFQNFYICYYRKHMEPFRWKKKQSHFLDKNHTKFTNTTNQFNFSVQDIKTRKTSKGPFKTLIPCVRDNISVKAFKPV